MHIEIDSKLISKTVTGKSRCAKLQEKEKRQKMKKKKKKEG